MASGYTAVVFVPVLLNSLLLIIATSSDNQTVLSLPQGWEEFCSTDEKFVHWNFTTLSPMEVDSMIQISCHIRDESNLNFTDIRKWSKALNPLRKIALRVDCSKNATFYAPWPMKAQHLVYFHVSQCRVNGFYEEHFSHIITELPDELRVLTIKDCVVPLTFKVLARQLNYTLAVKPAADCGPLTAESFVFSGIELDLDLSDSFSDLTTNAPEVQGNESMEDAPFDLFDKLPVNITDGITSQSVETDSTTTDPLFDLDCINFLSELTFFRVMTDQTFGAKLEVCLKFAFEKLNDDTFNLPHKCNFDNLRHLDESNTTYLGSSHVQRLKTNSRFKELHVYNLSRVNYNQVPGALLKFQDYEIFPKLEILDLSYNNISVIPPFTYGGDYSQKGTIDLRYNNIKVLSRLSLDHIVKLLPYVFIRLEGNPINCSCEIVDEFYTFLKENPELGLYNYLRTMKCFSPAELWGVEVSSLSPSQGKCKENFPTYLLPLAVALGSCVFVLVIAIAVLIRLRKEMTILLYTRLGLNAQTGCRKTQPVATKHYDVFLSTCDNDRDWLLQNMLPLLNNSKTKLRLCLRENWEPGIPIADNAITSVESSTYTLAVISRNSIDNEWCQFEFSIALHQSLQEKRRHLVLVFKEEVDKDQLPSDIRKYAEICPSINFNKRLFRDRVLYAVSCRERISISDAELQDLDQTPIKPPSIICTI